MRFLVAIFVVFAVSVCTTNVPRPKNDFDLKIEHARIVDGTGAPWFRGDIGVRGDTIVMIGDLSSKSAATTIDAGDMVVSPGFIDLLGQSENAVLIDPHVEGKVRQGVTTEVTGEGHSPGPLNDAMIAQRKQAFPTLPTWHSLGEFMRVLQNHGTAINFAFYVGAANAREIVLGNVNRAPTADELKRMEAIVDQAMREGAVGLSSALIYVPGVFAKTDELAALASVAARYGGGYFTHLRNEADDIVPALEEAFTIGREARTPVNIFHLKIGGRQNWGRMPEVINRIEKERAGGLDVAANVYPYVASATSLTALVPTEYLEGGYPAFLARIARPENRAKVLEGIEKSAFYGRLGGATGVLVTRIPNPAMAQYERKRLSEIGEMMHLDPLEAALRLFQASPYSPSAIYFSMSEDDVKTALATPWVSVGSDSAAVVGTARNAGAHPRAYGTFPRVVGHYVRDEHLFTLEEAVRKITSQAASRVRLRDRGVIRPGMKADLVVFDPQRIRDVATYEDPHHFSEGISDVIVNGVAVLRNGHMTAALPGRVLRRE